MNLTRIQESIAQRTPDVQAIIADSLYLAEQSAKS